MCQVCIELLAQVPPEVVAVLEKHVEEALAHGAKITKELEAAGVYTMLPETFSDEEKANGTFDRVASIFALACISGFAVNNAIHDSNVALQSDELIATYSQVGWAAGHMNQTATKN